MYLFMFVRTKTQGQDLRAGAACTRVHFSTRLLVDSSEEIIRFSHRYQTLVQHLNILSPCKKCKKKRRN